MSKRQKKHDDLIESAVCTEPHVVAAQVVADKWAGRVTGVTNELQKVQRILRILSEKVEKAQTQGEEVRAEAQLLSSLKLDELLARRNISHPKESKETKASRAAAAAGAKSPQQQQPPQSAAVSNKGTVALSASMSITSEAFTAATLHTLEPMLVGLDERKRQRITNALNALFKSTQPLEEASPLLAGVSGTTARTDVIAVPTTFSVPPDLDGAPPQFDSTATPGAAGPLASSQTDEPLPSSVSAAAGNKTDGPARTNSCSLIISPSVTPIPRTASTTSDPRKPRDVPQALWDEMLLLRARRNLLDEALSLLVKDLQDQMARFSLLQEMEVVGSCGSRAARYHAKTLTDQYVCTTPAE